LKNDEYNTYLRKTQVVPKNCSDIRFRGKLDTLYAFILNACVMADELGIYDASADLQSMGQCCLNILGAHVRDAPIEQICMLGLSEDALRKVSHNPQEYGIAHFLPCVTDGALIAAVNLVRVHARETECDAVEYFADKQPSYVRALNRISSAAYIIMCRIKGDFYAKKGVKQEE
jgi:ethanolamine utilization cobalamin adenosyltransferase